MAVIKKFRIKSFKQKESLLELEKVTVSPLITSESFIKLEQIQEAFERLIQPESDLQVIIKL